MGMRDQANSFPGNLCQCLISPTVKDFSLISNLTPPSAGLEPFPRSCHSSHISLRISEPDPLGLFIKPHQSNPKRVPAARASTREQRRWVDTAPQQTQKQRQKYKWEVDQRCQAGAAMREGNIPSISRPIPPGIPSGLWQGTHGRQHTHSRQLPPEAARWLRNTSCLRLPAQDTAPGHRPGRDLGAHKLGGLPSNWAVLGAGPEGWSTITCRTRARMLLAAFLTLKRWKGSVKVRQGEA